MSGPPQTSPTSIHPHHHHPGHPQQAGPSQPNGHGPSMSQPQPPQAGKQNAAATLSQMNEATWLHIGTLAEMMGNLDGAMDAYESALRQNPYSIPAMNQISCVLRTKEQFPKAVEYLQNILNLEQTNGDIWGSLGHCYLMMDDLQKAYQAYQQALYHLRDPKEPKLWYGIGILYDRYGSLDHAEEAFTQVMRMDPHFEKANEIYFRLGIIYKQQQKYPSSLECFRYIVHDPPRPLTEEDIWFQIGHVYEQQKDYNAAKDAYKRVLDRDPNHAKVLQQLGWLHHQQNQSFDSQAQAIEYLEKSVGADNSDAQSWYLLGRCYMSQQKYPKAYEAYQQAVYRDGRNPTFWCSIGVLYYQINQYRDALDAYSRAIRLNPYISEVWYDLGTLYESCNNQVNDALDAYQRAADLDPSNVHIKARLNLLRSGQAVGSAHNPPAPLPQDVHPQSYQASGPPGVQWGAQGTQPPAAQHQRPPGPPAISSTLPQIPQGAPGSGPAPSPYRPADSIPSRPLMRSPEIRPGEPQRHPSMRRGFSPSPKISNHAPSLSYSHPSQHSQGPPPQQQPGMPPHPQSMPPQQQQGPPPQQALPPPPPQPPMQQGPPTLQQHNPPPNRILNPQHHNTSPQHQLSSANGANGQGMTVYGHRGGSPLPEVKPILDDRMPSPTSNYPPHHGHGQAHLQHAPSGIANGAPPPASALAAAEEAARNREREDSKIPNTKRHREWEEDDSLSAKKVASNENRARMDDHFHHRASPSRLSPDHDPRRSSSERPPQQQPQPQNEEYHRSAAPSAPPGSMHGMPNSRPVYSQLPSMTDTSLPPPSSQQGQQQQQQQHGQQQQMRNDDREREQRERERERERDRERKEIVEPPARKMEVDEDYDDEPESNDKHTAQQGPILKKEENHSPISVKPNGILGGEK